jgi:hypothetical protein
LGINKIHHLLFFNRYLKIKGLLFVTLVLSFNKTHSQNLIQNGSFENYTNIDCTYGGFWNATMPYPYPDVLDNWHAYQSPDYFNSVCSSAGWYSLPNNVFGNSNAKSGNAYVGIANIPVTGGTSEYIYQQLSSPLQIGKIYCLSFFISKADRKEYALKNIGAYFSSSLPIPTSNLYLPNIPQVINQNGFVTDTTSWTEIQGCFTANGGEQYITIGAFDSNGNIDTLYTGTNNPIPFDPAYSYYFIDEVTLYDQTTVGLNDLSKNLIEIYPNPATSILNINDKHGQYKNATVSIIDYFGQTVYLKSFSTQIDLFNYSPGIYFLNIQNNSTKKSIKFIKQ